MNIYLVIIIAILVGEYLLNLTVERLNVKHISEALPAEFAGFYDGEKYKKSQHYLIDNTNFILFREGFFTAFLIIFIILGGFNAIDLFARRFNFHPITTGLLFAGALLIGYEILAIPFSAYRTFVIEARYGFNKTTLRTFVSDNVKGLLLSAIIAGAAFAAILWFFEISKNAWFWSWQAVNLFQLILIYIAPAVIMPLFNKFIPLEEGELKKAIEDYAQKENFKIKGIFKMDASRRSSKSNAFFTGFGKFRRIALFDTLIRNHSKDELVSVLAHEIGHYKKGHIIKGLIFSFVSTGLMFFILSFFINNPHLVRAFRMEHVSLYGSIIVFGFLYSPISLINSLISNILSRKNEREADLFVVTTFNKPEAFITALKKLSVDNLSNLTPHPAKVFLDYSHPPVLRRIEAIRQYIK